MKINLKKLPASLRAQTEEIADRLGVSVCDDGYPLLAEEGEELKVDFDGKTVCITYPARNQFFRGLRLFKQHFAQKAFSIRERCTLDELGIMLDCSRNAVRTVAHVKEIIQNLALMGYNQLQLYTEDTYEIENEPYFGYMTGRYTAAELREIDDYAEKYGIELIPCIQTLAHIGRIFRWKDYSEICDIGDILLVDEEKTYALIERMFAAMSKNIRSRKIHIGMDEAVSLGKGVYKERHGEVNRSEIMLRHLGKVVSIAEKFGYKPMMWSDMFFRIFNDGEYYVGADKQIPQEVKDLVPENLSLVYWDYYTTDREIYDAMLDHHLSFNRDVVFAGGAWMWGGFAPFNAFAMQISDTALDSCKAHGIRKIFMTMWGDNGAECSDFGVLPTLSKIAERAYGHEDRATQEKAFFALTDIPLDDFMNIDAVNIINKNEAPNSNNPSKYMLYNDCIGGLYDYLVKQGDGAVYAQYAERLNDVAQKAGRYTYIFETQRALAEVLELKYELGIKTREVYKKSDKKAMKELVDARYRPLIKKLNAFYAAFESQWSKENKPNGFEVQDYRLGGLIRRVEHCAVRLENYADGKCDTLPELDGPLLDPWGGGANAPKQLSSFNWFASMIGVDGL